MTPTEQQQGDEERPRLEEFVEDLAEEHTSWIPIIAAITCALSVVALVLLVDPLRHARTDALSGDTASLRHDLKGFGVGGVLMILTLAISHAVLLYPAEILDAAVGFVYGFWFGLPLIMFGWLLNGILCHQTAESSGPARADPDVRPRALRRLRARVDRGGVTLLLTCRMVPSSPSACSVTSPVSARVPFWTFIWTTMVGYIPLTPCSSTSAVGSRRSR